VETTGQFQKRLPWGRGVDGIENTIKMNGDVIQSPVRMVGNQSKIHLIL